MKYYSPETKKRQGSGTPPPGEGSVTPQDYLSPEEPTENIHRQRWWQMPASLSVDLAELRSRNTIKLVLFVARQTFGWYVRSAIMSYDEMTYGRFYAPGKRMKDVSGLKNDEAISEAIKDSVARGLLEVFETNVGLAYRIPDSYWNEAEVAPRYEFWRYSPPWAAYSNGCAQENRADSAIESGGANGCAQKSQAPEQENLSTAIEKSEHSNKKTQAQPLRESAPEGAPRAPLNTFLDTSNLDTSRDTLRAPTVARPRTTFIKNEEEDEETEGRKDDFKGSEGVLSPASFSEADGNLAYKQSADNQGRETTGQTGTEETKVTSIPSQTRASVTARERQESVEAIAQAAAEEAEQRLPGLQAKWEDFNAVIKELEAEGRILQQQKQKAQLQHDDIEAEAASRACREHNDALITNWSKRDALAKEILQLKELLHQYKHQRACEPALAS